MIYEHDVRSRSSCSMCGNCREGVGVGGASLKSISDFAICHEISFHNATAAAAQVPAGGGAEGGRGVDYNSNTFVWRSLGSSC